MKKELWLQIVGAVAIVTFAAYSWQAYSASFSGASVARPQVKSASGSSAVLTKEEVALHKTNSDCWFIIAGKAYDVTPYTSHPGGRENLTAFCGQDATQAFDTKGGRGAHSQTAVSLLKNFYVGELGGKVQQSAKEIQQNASQIKNFKEGENKDDD